MKLIVNISMILAVSIFIWWNISSANQEVEEARRDIEESEKAEEVKEFKLNYNRNVTEKDDAVSCIHEGKIALLVGDPIYIDKHTFTALSVDESEGIRRRSNKSDIVIRSMDPFKKSDLEPTNGIVPFVNIYPSTGNFGILIDRWSEDYFFRDIEHFDLANSEDWFKYNKTQSLILIDDHFVGKLDFRFSKGKDVSHLKESMDKYKLLKCMYSSIKRKAVYSFRGDHKVKAYHYWHSDMIVSMFENEVVIISMQREINHIERYLRSEGVLPSFSTGSITQDSRDLLLKRKNGVAVKKISGVVSKHVLGGVSSPELEKAAKEKFEQLNKKKGK